MVSTKFYYNVRDTQEQLFTAVVAVLQRSYKTSVLKKLAIFAGKNLCQSLFFVNFVKRRLQFSCEYCKIFKNSFFIEHLRWLLLQVLHKKEVPKNFATFTRMYRYRSPFLSSCRAINCNFVKIEGPVQLFCSEFCQISQNNFIQNNFERLFLDVKRCCGK